MKWHAANYVKLGIGMPNMLNMIADNIRKGHGKKIIKRKSILRASETTSPSDDQCDVRDFS